MKIGRPASQGPSASTSKGLMALAISKFLLTGMDSIHQKKILAICKKARQVCEGSNF